MLMKGVARNVDGRDVRVRLLQHFSECPSPVSANAIMCQVQRVDAASHKSLEEIAGTVMANLVECEPNSGRDLSVVL